MTSGIKLSEPVEAEIRQAIVDYHEATGTSIEESSEWWMDVCAGIITDGSCQQTDLTPRIVIELTNFVVEYQAMEENLK